MKIICESCYYDVSELLYIELKSENGKLIFLCDECYQELGKLEKRNGIWVEFALVDGIEYFIT